MTKEADRIRYFELHKMNGIKPVVFFGLFFVLKWHWACFGLCVEKIKFGICITLGFFTFCFVAYKPWIKAHEENKV